MVQGRGCGAECAHQISTAESRTGRGKAEKEALQPVGLVRGGGWCAHVRTVSEHVCGSYTFVCVVSVCAL